MKPGLLLLTSGTPNRRRWPRYKLDLRVRILNALTAKFPEFHGRATELNQGGLTLFAFRELQLGEKLAIEFVPPQADRPVRVRGCIRNRNGYGYGVEFITENDSDQYNVGQLETTLRELAPAQ